MCDSDKKFHPSLIFEGKIVSSSTLVGRVSYNLTRKYTNRYQTHQLLQQKSFIVQAPIRKTAEPQKEDVNALQSL